MSNRIYQLDSLRGLAALSVVIHHSLLPIPIFLAAIDHQTIPFSISLLTYSPLHLFWEGGAAVILFYVLSGFVLALPYYENKALPYSNYLLKRICRLYIPYIVSICISILLMAMLSTQGISGLSTWFNAMWNHIPNASDWISLLFVTDIHATHNVNTVTWSLIYEMQISIIYPFLVVGVKRNKLWMVILFIFGLHLFKIRIARYAALFIMGCLLAKHREYISNYISKMNNLATIISIIIALFLYLAEWLIPARLNTNIFVGIGSALIIALALGNVHIQTFLSHSPILYLGKISYSLYLVHTIVILTLTYIFRNILPIYIILVAVPFISIIFAHIYNKFVEKPAIVLGKRISA